MPRRFFKATVIAGSIVCCMSVGLVFSADEDRDRLHAIESHDRPLPRAVPAFERPAEAPTLQPWQALGAVAYVGILAAVAFFGVRYVKRRRTSSSSFGLGADGIHLLSSRRIGLNSAVHVLEIKGRTVVMATHGNAVGLVQLRESDES